MDRTSGCYLLAVSPVLHVLVDLVVVFAMVHLLLLLLLLLEWHKIPPSSIGSACKRTLSILLLILLLEILRGWRRTWSLGMVVAIIMILILRWRAVLHQSFVVPVDLDFMSI